MHNENRLQMNHSTRKKIKKKAAQWETTMISMENSNPKRQQKFVTKHEQLDAGRHSGFSKEHLIPKITWC